MLLNPTSAAVGLPTDTAPPPSGNSPAHHHATGRLRAAQRDVDLGTGDYIVCTDSDVYHLHDHPRLKWSTGASLCRQVDCWPAGGRYRTGRPKPTRATHPPRGRQLCAVCASILVSRDAFATPAAAGASPTARRIAWLWHIAAGMPYADLAEAARWAPRRLARHVARLELRRRELAREVA